MNSKDDEVNGIKLINIHAKTNYHIVSAYEFELLKKEDEVKELIKSCSIYLIVQRPLLYINNLTCDEEILKFEITDNSENPPLQCVIDLNDFFTENGRVEVLFHKDERDEQMPFNDVAGIKFYTQDNKFIAWYSPQRMLYEHLFRSPKVRIDGDIRKYLDYTVLYIGQAFEQKIWDRLTKHEKLQKTLIQSYPMSDKARRTADEISLILLEVYNFDETCICGGVELIEKGEKPIIHKLNSEDVLDFIEKRFLEPDTKELTNEVEALLISLFKPEYNEKLKGSDINIKTGTRSVGYTQATLVIEKMPAILKTKHFILEPRGNKMSNTTDNYYIKGLTCLQKDLNIVMDETRAGDNFKEAEEIAKAAFPLIVGEINRLQGTSIKLNFRNPDPVLELRSDPMKLRAKLEQLCNLMEQEEEKRKFKEYIAMLDSLINERNI